MADLSPCRGDSKASRNPMFSIPTDAYCFDEQHTNITLQTVLGAVVADLNVLAELGLKTKTHGEPWYGFMVWL